MASSETEAQVQAHYGSPQLYEVIFNALQAAGKDMNALTPRDLAPVDQFHSGGWRSTLALAQMAGISAQDEVLDVGGGIGGPARYIAAELGCKADVLDLSAEFCEAGEQLTALLNMSDKVRFKNGSALEIPYPDAHFDVVVTQHSTMNIPHKETLYSEIARVLKPGGRLAMHEFMAGATPDGMIFPVPWARSAEISDLRVPEHILDYLHSVGLKDIVWHDVTSDTLASFKNQMSEIAGAGSLGLQIVIPDIQLMIKNLFANLQAGRVRVILAVLKRE